MLFRSVPGYLDVREAICGKLLRENNLSFLPEQIVVSTGAKQCIANLVLTVVDKGDEVIIPTPYWVTYSEIVKLAGGIPVMVKTTIDNNFKITPQICKLWIKILKAVPDSVLFLYANNASVKVNLFNEFKKAGIHESRIKFSGKLSKDKYLERYKVCDLFLDTHPYNGGVTSSDALWTGLPVITLQGNSFASRMSASLLHAIGQPELIAHNEDGYLSLAINLANNPEKIKKIKLFLDSNRKNCELFDSKLLTKYIERA